MGGGGWGGERVGARRGRRHGGRPGTGRCPGVTLAQERHGPGLAAPDCIPGLQPALGRPSLGPILLPGRKVQCVFCFYLRAHAVTQLCVCGVRVGAGASQSLTSLPQCLHFCFRRRRIVSSGEGVPTCMLRPVSTLGVW